MRTARLGWTMGVALGLAACGGGSGTTTTSGSGVQAGAVPAATAPSGGVVAGAGVAPLLAGVPATRVAANDDYLFQPLASDADGDTLRFTVESLPAWAVLDPLTGRISGKPRPNDVGDYGPITLSVSDGRNLVHLAPFSVTVDPAAVVHHAFTLSWRAPERNEDGSALASLPTFKIHYGRRSQAYDDVIEVQGQGASRYEFADLEPGTWYLAMTSVSPDGLESELSRETVAVVN